MTVASKLRRFGRWLLRRKLPHRHRWFDTAENAWCIAIEQGCACGARRHHLFEDMNANGYALPRWREGPHPGPDAPCA